MTEPGPTKAANIMATVFAVLFACFAILQLGVVIFSDIHWIVKIILAILAVFFVAVIIFLVIEKRKEPPIKY